MPLFLLADPNLFVVQKVVSLRSDPEELATSVSKQWDGLTINSLRVGAMVNARVAAVMKVDILLLHASTCGGL